MGQATAPGVEPELARELKDRIPCREDPLQLAAGFFNPKQEIRISKPDAMTAIEMVQKTIPAWHENDGTVFDRRIVSLQKAVAVN